MSGRCSPMSLRFQSTVSSKPGDQGRLGVGRILAQAFAMTLVAIVTVSWPHWGHAQEFMVPTLRAPVQDDARMFSPRAAEQVSALIQELKLSGGPQIQVLTVQSLGGLPIEVATLKVVDSWKLGDAKRDDGLLLFIAKKERKLRFEVGRGLEGDLPDVIAKRIIVHIITPLFKAGQVDEGLKEGVVAAMGYVAPDFLKTRGQTLASQSRSLDRRASSDSAMGSLLEGILFFLFLTFVLFLKFSRSALLSGMGPRTHGRHWGGGGSWGASRGGGGWSGGGGGFSGGGASGDW